MTGVAPQCQRVLALVGVVVMMTLGGPFARAGVATTSPYAPVDRAGPRLSIPMSQLAASLTCTGQLRSSRLTPIVLVAGTTVTPQENFGWNYERAFSAAGRPYCTVTTPSRQMDDIQVSAQYVVYALRTVAARAHRRIDVLGHSQGGMLPRWALRFWPDTRKLVDDYIAFAPTNHGTLLADGLCLTGCAPAIWQQGTTSHFQQALNSGQETFPGISYTDVYSHNDEIVQPNLTNSGSSSLHGGGGLVLNVSLQDVCPEEVNEHLAIGTYDPVGYALALDALNHPGPAKISRISTAVCTQLFQPGVNPSTFATDYLTFASAIAQTVATYPRVPVEPPLACYTLAAGCPQVGINQ